MIKNTSSFIRWLIVPTLVMGCGSGEPIRELKAVTYNAGLARGFVSFADERAPEVVSRIANFDADLVCLQETWQASHWDEIVSATSHHTTRLPDEQESGGVGCMSEEIGDLADCVRMNCEGTDNLMSCALASCSAEFGATSADCQTCLAANIGLNNIDAIESACVGDNVGTYTYGGSYGIGLLSRIEPRESEEIRFESRFIRRGAIYNQLDAGTLGTVHVFCTHLTAVFDSIPYPGTEGSWEEEQSEQITALRTYIDSKAGGEPVVLLGDFNVGPAYSMVQSELPEQYTDLAQGFDNAYVEGEESCTYCAGNSLVNSNQSVTIDHIFTRKLSARTPTRVLDEAVSIENVGETHLSDHFGVEVLIQE